MDTKIFIRAAQITDESSYCFSCLSINDALHEKYKTKRGKQRVCDEGFPQQKAYKALYEIRNETFSTRCDMLERERIKEIRVLALLFAAQVFKNKGKL